MTEDTKVILEKLVALDSKIDTVNASLSEQISSMDERISSMDERISSMDERILSMDERISSLDNQMTDMRLTLENVTNKNIQIIAEGHLDLSRKLSEALKVENEKEMLLLRVNRLENDMRQVKHTLEIA